MGTEGGKKRMTSRERIQVTLDHREPDMLPVDFGGGLTTGIHVSTLYKLRQYFGLDEPGRPVRVIEPFMMLGEIEDDLRDLMGGDLKMLHPSTAIFFGFENSGWKEWELEDGTPVLVPGGFNTERNPDDSVYLYPQGDRSVAPSAKMPKGGHYFDAIIRQEPLDYDKLNPEDNMEEFGLVSDEEIAYLCDQAREIFDETNYAIESMAVFSSFGDIAAVPGMALKHPRGIRDVAEWYMATVTHRDFIKEVFERQCELAIENYRRIHDSLGDVIDIVFIMGTDFGCQDGLFSSVDTYRELFKPYVKRVNDWVHAHTTWKTLVHSCGSVYRLIPEFIDAGYDIYNPVQISAADMEPTRLKKEFGRDIVFMGGGVDPQRVLPFGTHEEVREQVRKNIETFSRDGGYIFANVHNLQPNIPTENIAAMIEVVQEYRK
jgi:hypothetical protein